MDHPAQFIAGQWCVGGGDGFQSIDPALGQVIWQAQAASAREIDAAVDAARTAFAQWSAVPLDDRVAVLERFAQILSENQADMARAISRETGKPLWDAMGEAGAMARKVGISLSAYHERTGTRTGVNGSMRTRLNHRPHGVLAVYGPYNFPGHLPNGHIVPALLAGNSIVFKPSELTPMVAELTVQYWQQAGLPDGVINLVQGGRQTGIDLSAHDDIDGILFTGSVPTGQALHRQLAGKPEKILALELGGNNPLIVDEVSDHLAAAILTVQSAFVTSGQRCTCARRLIVPEGKAGDDFVNTLIDLMARIRVGAWFDEEEPFMGPLISDAAAARARVAWDSLTAAGAEILHPMAPCGPTDAFLTPGLLDVTAVDDRPDEEVFGPLLQVIRVPGFEAALAEANNTRFGLAAGLLSDDRTRYDKFYARARAGIVNWNRPLTGAASDAPFGGIGLSGNHRPSAYYAADYCAWPVASLEDAADKVTEQTLPKGIRP